MSRIPSMSPVLDSSVTLAWVYAEEATAAIHHVSTGDGDRGVGSGIVEAGVSKCFWRWVCDRGRTDSAFRDSTLADLALLPIRLDAETGCKWPGEGRCDWPRATAGPFTMPRI